MALADALDIAVACEGVETAEQAEFLGKAGSKVLQGEFFAKPMPLAEIMLVAGPPAAASVTGQRSARAVG